MSIFPHTTTSQHPSTSLPPPVNGDKPSGPPADSVEPPKRFGLRPGVLSFASLGRRGSGTGLQPPMTPPANVSKQLGMPAVAASTDPSHLSQFSLKLNELMNKAFVAPNSAQVSTIAHTGTSPFTGVSISVPRIQNISYGNNRLPNRVRVIEMTRLMVDELHTASTVDPYLLRAVSRTILKTISQFVSRIESQLVSPRTDPTALQIPVSVRGAQPLPAAMEFNLALISLEWIVEESLERCLEGLPPLALLHSPSLLIPTSAEGQAQPPMPSFVYEILSPLREQMEASIIHVVQPLLVNIKSSITTCLLRANAHPFEPQRAPSIVLEPENTSTNKIPWHKELEERLDAAYRLLMLRIVDRCGQDGQAWFISVATHTIWKGLVVLTSRSVFAPASVVEAQFSHTFGRTSSTTPSSAVLNSLLAGEAHAKRVPTPTQLAHALRSVSLTSGHRHRRPVGESMTGTHTPVEKAQDDFEAWSEHFALPANSTDCFVINPLLVAEQLHDLQVLERLMRQFCSQFLDEQHGRPGQRARSSDSENTDRPTLAHGAARSPDEQADMAMLDDTDDTDEDLARAALKEAFSALRSTVIVLRTLLQEPDALQYMSQASLETHPTLSPVALRAFRVIPSLLLVHIAFCRIPPGWVHEQEHETAAGLQLKDEKLPTPPQVFGYSWHEYETTLTGFGTGELVAMSLTECYGPILEQLCRQVDEKCGLAEHESLPASLLSPTVSDISSDGSTDDLPAAMAQSMPTLDAGRPLKTPVTMALPEETGTHRRSRSQSRGSPTLAPRLWRKHPSSGSKFALPHALPPRVSRAHATSSLGRGRQSPRCESQGLPRSTTDTLAHMQRHALLMFENVLQRVVSMHEE